MNDNPMATEPQTALAPVTEIDISHIQTEDGKPVDSVFSERQQRLLVDALYSSWKPAAPFVALSNVGLFYGLYRPPLVPDMMLSLRAELPQGDAVHQKQHRAYFVWEYAKLPEVAVEIVSNRDGNEFGSKLQRYAEIGITFYIVYDPELHYGQPPLHLFRLNDGRYTRSQDFYLELIGLRIGLWEGDYEGTVQPWLRWFDEAGNLLLTGEENLAQMTLKAEQAEAKADEAEAKADEAEVKAKQAEAIVRTERERSEKLAQKLRDLGINPEQL